MKSKLIRLLLLAAICLTGLIAQARQVYVGVNSSDCAHCLMGMSYLKTLPFFDTYKYVLKGRDKRQASMLLAEFMGVKPPPQNIICSDSLFKIVSPSGENCVSVFEADHTLRIRVSMAEVSNPRCLNWLRRALSDRLELPVAAQRILPDTSVFSPATVLVAASNGVYLFDTRFSKYTFVDQTKLLTSSPTLTVVSSRNWPIQWAHNRVMGDTTQFAEVQRLLADPRSIGRKHLAWVNLFALHDTLYGVVEYVRPQYRVINKEQVVYHEPILFLVRIQQGLPQDWRHISIETPLDSFYLQPYNGVTRRNGRWVLPIMNFDVKDFTKAIPLEYEAIDSGVELCAVESPRSSFNHLPTEITKLPMTYSFSEYQYAGNFLVFSYVNKVVNTQTGKEFSLKSFAREANTYATPDTTAVDAYMVQSAVEVQGELRMLLKSKGRLYYLEANAEGAERLVALCALSRSEAIRWGLNGKGEVVGFNTTNNSFLKPQP